MQSADVDFSSQMHCHSHEHLAFGTHVFPLQGSDISLHISKQNIPAWLTSITSVIDRSDNSLNITVNKNLRNKTIINSPTDSKKIYE
jgi:hypothetical protein